MKGWVLAGLVVLGLFAVVGFAVTYVMKLRQADALKQCEFNLGGIALFAAHHAKPEPGTDFARMGIDPAKLLHEVPPGTIVLPGVPPEERLSWVVRVLPGLSQKRQNNAALLGELDVGQPWSAQPNQRAARTRLASFLCPAGTPAAGTSDPAPTNYVGIAGLGVDAATLTLTPPDPAPPRAGCFRYDAPTPFAAITDGLSQSLLLGERSGDLGPWLRGGPATVRGIDDAPGSAALFGTGGQFGGNHTGGANWALADGSVRFITDRIDPPVLFRLATIAGREAEIAPVE